VTEYWLGALPATLHASPGSESPGLVLSQLETLVNMSILICALEGVGVTVLVTDIDGVLVGVTDTLGVLVGVTEILGVLVGVIDIDGVGVVDGVADGG
tara:strand:+ start:1334 stop:1627 length:294 start_codon:yes stop_codon:yes gene_type:complete